LGDEKLKQFCRLWTMKESYMKFTGEGMKLALNRFEFNIEDSVKVFRDGILIPCFIKEYEFLDYCISICAQKNDFAPNLEFVDLL
jgi:4'-phosphopantetheinyl transferase